MSSPTSRTLAELRKRGYAAQVVEKWVAQARKRVDLFGCIDIVAMGPEGIVGVQATTMDHKSDHLAKIMAEPRLRQWLECGGRFELWCWAKRGARGRRKLWTLDRTAFELSRVTRRLRIVGRAA